MRDASPSSFCLSCQTVSPGRRKFPRIVKPCSQDPQIIGYGLYMEHNKDTGAEQTLGFQVKQEKLLIQVNLCYSFVFLIKNGFGSSGRETGDITQEKQTGYSSLAVSHANRESQVLPFLVTSVLKAQYTNTGIKVIHSPDQSLHLPLKSRSKIQT